MKDNNSTHHLSSDDEQSLRDLLKQFGEGESEKSESVEIETETQKVLLLIGEQIERAKLQPGKAYQLGRFEEISDYQIDLASHKALKYGVSRLHASIFMKGKHIYIIDHDSSNGTYLEGRRVRDKPLRLTNGCQIMLGLLHIQVMFH